MPYVTGKRRDTWAAGIAALVAVLSACDGNGGANGVADGGDDGPAASPDLRPAAAPSCVEYAQARCAKDNACTNYVIWGYGDFETCVDRVALRCTLALQAPGSRASPESVARCAKRFLHASCDDIYFHDPTPECEPPAGTFANGSTCFDDAQCASTFCWRSNGQLCGTCITGPAEGDSCEEMRCPGTLGCVGPEGQRRCTPLLDLGANCKGSTGACLPSLTCGPDHTCVPALPRDAICLDGINAVFRYCDASRGYYCDPDGSNRCRRLPVAGIGEPCGLLPGGFTGCAASGYCDLKGKRAGTCRPAAEDGAPCVTSDNGPGCMLPALCVDDRCRIPGADTCN